MIDASNHLGLVHRIARQVYRERGTDEADDVVGAGMVGLMQAASTFDESRGLAFSTFAAPRIRGAMWDYMRSRRGRSRDHRRSTEVGLSEHIPDPHNLENAILDRLDLRKRLRCLGEQERLVIERLYWRGESIYEVGRSFGVTGSRVSQIRTKALRRMRGLR